MSEKEEQQTVPVQNAPVQNVPVQGFQSFRFIFFKPVFRIEKGPNYRLQLSLNNHKL